jgi:tetratricopeptide (TPR) repeat protein
MFRRARGVTYAYGMLIAVAAVLMANIVDFSLEIAGVLVPMLVIAACLERLLPDPNGNEDAELAAPAGRRRVLIGTGLALVGAGALLVVATQGATRTAPTRLAGVSTAAVRGLVAEHFSQDHHAFYLAGRSLLEAGDRREAVRAFDRAVALRPDSKHAHLFRFATNTELGDFPAAARDLHWLLASDHETFERALQICKRSASGEAMLLAAMPELTELSYKIAEWFERSRPDLVERMAMVLREKYPGRVFGIEAVLGHLYVKHGNLEPAKRIATAMLVNKDTRDQGWVLEALIQSHSGHPYEAFVLYGDLCERQPDRTDVCWGAIEAVLAAKRPLEALAFLARRREGMMETALTAAQYWYGFGVAHMQLGNSEEAAAAARTAHGLRPDDLASSLLLAEALRGAGQHEEARTLLDNMRQRYPKDTNVQRLWRQTEIDLGPLGMAVEVSGVQAP